MNKNILNQSTLSLADIENTDSEILMRVASDLDDSQNIRMGHASHSSSSGRGHSSYVSGSAARAGAKKTKKNK